MEKNNGKIAIAIVAMFVVALSVVGFTYAYFTATVKGNTNDKSVTVQAGILQVDYRNGQEMYARNLVPGWISDGKHYYDPVKSIYDNPTTNVREVTATVVGTEGAAIASPTAENGITNPATFTVKNTGTDTAYYAIKLTNIENGIVDIQDDTQTQDVNESVADTDNFRVYLFKGTWTEDTVISVDDETGKVTGAIYEEELAVTGDDQLLSGAIEIAKNASDDYYVVLQYLNAAGKDQSANTNKTVKATVDIVGVVAEVDADGEPTGNYLDASGNLVITGTQAGA